MAEATFRIEHRRLGGETEVLGVSHDPLARVDALEPYAHELLDRREEGELLLIEQLTGSVVAQRPVWVSTGWDVTPEGVQA